MYMYIDIYQNHVKVHNHMMFSFASSYFHIFQYSWALDRVLDPNMQQKLNLIGHKL